MVRGTTAQFKFKLPYDFSELKIVKIMFWQPGNYGPSETRSLPIVKVLGQCFGNEENPREISVNLTEEETLRFSEKTKAYVQLRARNREDNAFATKQEEITVYPVYEDTTLDESLIPTPGFDGIVVLDGHYIE
jgi:hypothetical protein